MVSSFRPTSISAAITISLPESSTFYCKTANKGFWYYDAMQEHRSSGPTIYRKLIESAENEIGVWDTYLKMEDASLFNTLSSSVRLRVLTLINQKGELDNGGDNYHRFLEKIEKIQDSNGFTLQVAGICKSTHQKLSTARVPHDRFLFIDSRVFIVGSSLYYHSIENDNSHILNIANTSIVELQDEDNREILRNDFESYWDKTNSRYKYVYLLSDKSGWPIK